jgi:transcriptional regulator with XRE-family HTH domain
MGKAGKALKQVMTAYSISQNQLAEAMEIDRSNISRWSSETRDPGSETLLEIRQGLRKINPQAAEDFIQLFLAEPNGATE